jgi:hypothetical protein
MTGVEGKGVTPRRLPETGELLKEVSVLFEGTNGGRVTTKDKERVKAKSKRQEPQTHGGDLRQRS